MAISVVKAKYNELVQFFQAWVPVAVPGTGLYLIGQNAPRPQNPYIGFRPISSVERVGIDERRFAEDGSETLRGNRTITCDVFGFSDAPTRYDGNDDAWSLLQELRFSLGYPEVEDMLCNINCRVLDEGTVVDLSQTLNTTNEPRAQWQFKLSTAMSQVIDSGSIIEINAEGTYTGTFDTINETIQVIKP